MSAWYPGTASRRLHAGEESWSASHKRASVEARSQPIVFMHRANSTCEERVILHQPLDQATATKSKRPPSETQQAAEDHAAHEMTMKATAI